MYTISVGKKLRVNKGETLVDEDDFDRVNNCGKWMINNRGYVVREIKGKTVLLHRFILDAKKGQIIDHKNGNKLDNRKENLRFCTQRQNIFNSRRTPGKSGYIGVFQVSKNRWRATMANVDLGCFKSAKEAAIAYDIKALSVRGEFAFLNFDRSNYV